MSYSNTIVTLENGKEFIVYDVTTAQIEGNTPRAIRLKEQKKSIEYILKEEKLSFSEEPILIGEFSPYSRSNLDQRILRRSREEGIKLEEYYGGVITDCVKIGGRTITKQGPFNINVTVPDFYIMSMGLVKKIE